MSLTVEAAYALCSRAAGVGLAISSAEILSRVRDWGPGGPYDPAVMAVDRGGERRRVPRTLASRTGPLQLALVIRLSAGLLLLLGADSRSTITVGWTLAAATTFFTRWRMRYGGEDGADQMLSITSAALAAGLLLDVDNGLAALALVFVGAQGCLAYATAGIAKLISPQWRSGEAIRGVLATRTHGMRSPADLVRRWPLLAVAACWTTIAFETAFAVAPVLPLPALLVLFGVAASFHAVVAVTMGLNGFFWAFVATYPAIVYLNQIVTALFFGG